MLDMANELNRMKSFLSKYHLYIPYGPGYPWESLNSKSSSSSSISLFNDESAPYGLFIVR